MEGKHMIKFIAADLDGTLLNDKKQLPPDFAEVLKELQKRDIIFAPASGRQYYTLYNQLSPYYPDFMYIAENGTMVVKNGKELVCECMSESHAEKIIRAVRKIPTAFALLCCADCAYGEDRGDPVFLDNAAMYYARYESVDDLLTVMRGKKILKIAIYDKNDAAKHIMPELPEKPESLSYILSGQNWVDVMRSDVSKGQAIERLKEIEGWKDEECMCFGDYLNDLDMFAACGESYAMANGHEDVKKVAKYIAPSNEDNGVMRVIREKVLKEN